MKQATNPFAPVPLWRKRLPGYAAMGVATIALAVGLTTLQSARTTVAGTLLPVSEADAAAYGISAVYQLDDGSYRVEGSQKGFQSDVQAAVTIDAEGNVSAVEILSQDETESLGGQCVNPEFTSQYQGAAPFTLAGKSYTVTDPVTGAAYAAAGAAEEQPAAAGDFDPAQWRTFDTSPEARGTMGCPRRWIPAQRPWHGASCTQPCSARAHWTASRWRSPLRISRQRSSPRCVWSRPA